MNTRRSRSTLARSFVLEGLECRLALSAVVPSSAGAGSGTAEVAGRNAAEATHVTVKATTGTVGQPITFSVTVRAAASAGAPQGTVNIVSGGQVIQTITLSPSSSDGKYAYSAGTATLSQPPGGSAYYFGRHAITAQFVPSSRSGLSASSANGSFTVSHPAYTNLSGGVKIATITPGSGATIQSGQTANVLYTGYLEKNGQIFDDSVDHGDAPLSFTVGAGQVIAGFDAGTSGMQVGETRAIYIPSSQGYGHTAVGSIPANSTLIFLVTLKSIS